MQFAKEYYRRIRYSFKKQMVKRHVLEVIKWASKVSNKDLLDGNGKKALDVGCAYGYAAEVLELLGYETYGIDISLFAIKQAKKSCTGNFLICDARTYLPFKEGSFNLITCFDVLEHLQHPMKSMENMLALCSNFVVCTTPNKAVEKPIRKILKDLDKTHINVQLPSEWEKRIRDFSKYAFLKVETFCDLTPRIADRLLFFKSLKVPYYGLTVRILIGK